MLETDRLLLRRPVREDATAIAAEIGDAEVMRYIGTGETGTAADAVEVVREMECAWEEDGFGRFVVVRREDGAAVGCVGLLAWDPATWRSGTRAAIGDQAEIELGWRIVRSAWGQGYATEAALAVRDWALAEVSPGRLISLIHPENVRSARVAEKVGERHLYDVTTHRGLRAQLWSTGWGQTPDVPRAAMAGDRPQTCPERPLR